MASSTRRIFGLKVQHYYWMRDSKWTVITTHITYIGGSRISYYQTPGAPARTRASEESDFHKLCLVVSAQKAECAFCVQGT